MAGLETEFELNIDHDDICKAVEFWLNTSILQSECVVTSICQETDIFEICAYHVTIDEDE